MIRHVAADIQPVGILLESPVTHVGLSEDPLDHQKHIWAFNFVRFLARLITLSSEW